jgi:hypothetical protein
MIIERLVNKANMETPKIVDLILEEAYRGFESVFIEVLQSSCSLNNLEAEFKS